MKEGLFKLYIIIIVFGLGFIAGSIVKEFIILNRHNVIVKSLENKILLDKTKIDSLRIENKCLKDMFKTRTTNLENQVKQLNKEVFDGCK